MDDKKGAVRTRIALRVKVSNHSSHWYFRTVDLSDMGIFIAADTPVLAVDDVVDVQVQDLPGDAPVLPMRVVQATAEGYDLVFVSVAG